MPTLSPVSRSLIAFAAGAVTVLAFAPFSLFPLAVLGPALLLFLWLNATPGMAFREGWMFGLGLFGFGVFWMHISIDQFGNVGTVLAILITLLFVIAMALYYGFLGWLGKRLTGGGRDGVQLMVYPALWVLLEWVRGWFLTGFPWLALGYSQAGTPLQGFASLLGVYGVSFLVMVSAACLVAAFLHPVRYRFPALVLLAAVWGSGWLLDGVNWTQPSGAPLRVAMIQANISQEEKWESANRQPTIDLYLELTRKQWGSDIIVWPETSMPAFLHQLEGNVLKELELEAVQEGSELLIGIPVWRQEDKRYFNAMVTLGRKNDSYYKRHLVPFGEYMPMKWLLEPLIKILNIPMSNFAHGNGARPLLNIGDYVAGVSVCYEDAFGEEVIEALPEAAFLVNVSNDAWFGDSLAMPQHLQIARMRSIETGRYMLRSTNTGISALIGPKGELIQTSPILQRYVLSGEITPMTGVTPYARVGNWAVVLLTLLLLGVGLLIRRRDASK